MRGDRGASTPIQGGGGRTSVGRPLGMADGSCVWWRDKGVIWLSATRFRRSYFLCLGGADRMAFASFS